MLSQSDWEPIVQMALEETNKTIDRLVANFAPKLKAWLDEILNNPIPEDWRDELTAFVQRTADDDNLAIAPHSVTMLEQLIESCIAGTDDFAEFGPAPRGPARAASPTQLGASVVPDVSEAPPKSRPRPPLVGYPDIPVGRRGGAVNAEQLFDGKLASARIHFNTLQQLLEVAGEKIDAAKPGEEADVEYEAEMVRKHLFLYNEDLAVARDLWLRFNLSGDANSRLDGMPAPVVLSLPAFATPAQAQRMGQQLAAINRRLHGDNASVDALVTGMRATEMAADAAAILAGAGALVVAAKKTSRWAVVKIVVAGAAAIAADRATDAGLRAAGASDQTVRGVRLAAAVITLILLHRASKRPAPQEPVREPPATIDQAPPPAGTPAPHEPPSHTPTGPNLPNRVAPHGPASSSPSATGQAPPPALQPANTPPPGRVPTGPNPPKPVPPPTSKPPLPPPQSSPAYSWRGHRTAAEAEERLARAVHDLPDEVVVRWGDPIGSHGADVISVNTKTGKVTLWDAKYRSASVRIQPTETFQDPETLGNAIREAKQTIEANTSLPADIRTAALKNLNKGQVTTRTVGSGNARNSTLK
jgi:hypothetical protein